MSRTQTKPVAGKRLPPPIRVHSLELVDSPSPGTSWARLTRIPILSLFLALATIAIYVPIAKHEFVDYDDDVYVFDNPHVSNGLTWQNVKWSLTSDAAGNWHPLTWISHALDCQLYGIDNAGGHHITSLLFHLLNVVLLFLFLAQVTGAKGRSFVVAALFAIHPFNVESVAWIAERKNVLCTLFFVLGLLAYLWYVKRPAIWRYLAVAGCFVLGLASKPMVITFPFVLLLLDFWPLSRVEGYSAPSSSFPLPQVRLSRLIWEKLPLLLLSAASAVVTLMVQAQGNSIAPISVTPLSWRLANAVWAYSTYLWKTFVPIRLAPFYPTELIPIRVVLLSTSLLVGLGWVVWKYGRSRPYLPMGYSWFLGTLIPVIGLVQVGSQSMADRYAYIPLIGIFIAVVWGAFDLGKGKTRWLAGLASLVLVAAAILTVRQVSYWKDSVSLWSHARSVTSTNFVAEEDLAVGLAARGRSDEALPHFVIAQKIRPVDDTATMNIGINLESRGLHKLAILEFEHVVRYSQDREKLAEAHRRMGVIYVQAKDFRKGREQFIEAFKLTPNDPANMQNLAILEADEAVDKFSKQMPARPSAQTYFRLGQLQERALSLTDARGSYENALKVDPNLADARQALDNLPPTKK